MKNIRWGIIATGNIAHKFAKALNFESQRTGQSVLAAVASRSIEKARDFAQTWNIPTYYDSYEALLADESIDVVYVATPHSMHVELSIAALKAGKAVLCEKAVSLTQEELLPVIEEAKKQKKFYMEAMWMKFNPTFNHGLQWLKDGKIGAIQHILCDFCLDLEFHPENRIYNPSLGGGALLDVGIYPVTFASVFNNKKAPSSIRATFTMGTTGVDVSNTMDLQWDTGVYAKLTSGVNIKDNKHLQTACVVGEQGSIVLPEFWMAEKAILLNTDGQEIEKIELPFDCNGYEYEIREVEHCLQAGKSESEIQSWDDSVHIMGLLDAIRKDALQ